MIKIVLPSSIVEKLQSALNESGAKEIGGILMGEHLGTNLFEIADITIQKQGGSVATFVRVLSGAIGALKSFFKQTGNNYERFNYLGEWHSHPSFSLQPSMRDCETMRAIVDDPSVGARFAILMIVKISGDRVRARALAFLSDANTVDVTLVNESLELAYD